MTRFLAANPRTASANSKDSLSEADGEGGEDGENVGAMSEWWQPPGVTTARLGAEGVGVVGGLLFVDYDV